MSIYREVVILDANTTNREFIHLKVGYSQMSSGATWSSRDLPPVPLFMGGLQEVIPSLWTSTMLRSILLLLSHHTSLPLLCMFFSIIRYQKVAGSDGAWSVSLDPMTEGGPYTIVILSSANARYFFISFSLSLYPFPYLSLPPPSAPQWHLITSSLEMWSCAEDRATCSSLWMQCSMLVRSYKLLTNTLTFVYPLFALSTLLSTLYLFLPSLYNSSLLPSSPCIVWNILWLL